MENSLQALLTVFFVLIFFGIALGITAIIWLAVIQGQISSFLKRTERLEKRATLDQETLKKVLPAVFSAIEKYLVSVNPAQLMKEIKTELTAVFGNIFEEKLEGNNTPETQPTHGGEVGSLHGTT